MNQDEIKLLKMLFWDTGGEFYEIIDKDGLRKPAITTRLANVEIEDGGFNKEIWKVEINWRLLNKWLGDKNDRTTNL